MKTVIGLFVGLFMISPLNAQVIGDSIQIKQVATGSHFFEGPAWLNADTLLFTAISSSTIHYWLPADSSLGVYRSNSGNANGLLLHSSGDLMVCQHGPHQLARMPAGTTNIVAIVDAYDGVRLNSPNDLAEHSNGSIFFTDPPYGIPGGIANSELGYCGIYRINSQNQIYLLDNALTTPNGIGFSPDEQTLYVADTETASIYAWDVVNDTLLANRRLFFTGTGIDFDGMAIDSLGCLYQTCDIGVLVIAPTGNLLATIDLPHAATNCTFGFKDSSRLYVTANQSGGTNTAFLYSINGVAKDLPPNTVHQTVKKMKSELFYPNPCSDHLVLPLQGNEGQLLSVMVYGVNGVLLDSEITSLGEGECQLEWDTSTLPSGCYIIGLSYMDGTYSQRFYKL